MATARKLPSGSWRVRIYVGDDAEGKHQYKSFTAPTKKEAELLAARYNVTRKEKSRVEMTVSEASERFIKAQTNILAPSTIRNYNSIRKNYFGPINRIRLMDLSQDKIQQWVNDLAEEHSPKTVRNIHAFLSSVLAEYNPEEHYNIRLPKKKKTILAVPNDREVQALIDYFSDEPETQAAIMLAALVGMRRGEICALEWGDISDGKVYITKALSVNDEYEYVVKAPKTYEGMRVLMISKSLEEKILSLKKEDRQDELVFHFSPNALTARFVRARKHLDIKWRFHDLRHFYASSMLSMGIPDKYAMQRMGHATTNMLKTVYQHTFTQREIEVADTVNAQMEKFIK